MHRHHLSHLRDASLCSVHTEHSLTHKTQPFPCTGALRAPTLAGFAIRGQLVAGVAVAAGAAAVAVAAVHAAPVPVSTRVPHCRQSTESPHTHPGTGGEQSSRKTCSVGKPAVWESLFCTRQKIPALPLQEDLHGVRSCKKLALIWVKPSSRSLAQACPSAEITEQVLAICSKCSYPEVCQSLTCPGLG